MSGGEKSTAIVKKPDSDNEMKTRTETEKQKRKGDELPKAKKGGTRRQKAGAAPVELHGALGLEGQPQPHQQVGEALDADADRAVAEVGSARLLDRVVVDVDHVVQVAPAQNGKQRVSEETK